MTDIKLKNYKWIKSLRSIIRDKDPNIYLNYTNIGININSSIWGQNIESEEKVPERNLWKFYSII